MNKDDGMKEVELNEMDQEKQPMNKETLSGTEKNGSVKVKVPEDTEVKFTGLSKEELMKVAGTAGWVRTRWALLLLFWLGWLGMLAGAIVIIVQAPRCKPIPEMNWWNEGPLYQMSELSRGLKRVEDKLDYLSQMKVKGLVLGPVHTVQTDQPNTLNLMDIRPEIGRLEDLKGLLERAHRKGISVVLDLTPNYNNASLWFGSATSVAVRLREACAYWLQQGVDGVWLSDLKQIVNTDAWSSIHDVFNKTRENQKVALIGSALDLDNVPLLLNQSGVDLLLTRLPDPGSLFLDTPSRPPLFSAGYQSSLGWGLRSRPLTPVHHTLLLGLPGTALFTAGDELGLGPEDDTDVMLDLEDETLNTTAKSSRSFFQALAGLKVKERSLLHGDFLLLFRSDSAAAFLRVWDQSERFLLAVNWGAEPVLMDLSGRGLPAEGRVRVSAGAVGVDTVVALEKLQLGPGEALVLSYPFSG